MRTPQHRTRSTCTNLLAATLAVVFVTPRACAERIAIQSLDGEWELSRDERTTWHTVTVPGTFEEQIDRSFDGVAWLRRGIDPVPAPPGHRLLLHFDAVATEASVWLNGQPVGKHLGGWTPFRCDVTEAVKSAANGPWELLVRVDEKVGHNTQGFLPIITAHFGGIWQGVRLLVVPEGAIDDLHCLAWGDPDARQFELEIPFAWGEPRAGDVIAVSSRPRGATEWSPELEFRLRARASEEAATVVIPGDNRVRLKIPLPAGSNGQPSTPLLWSPESPQLYEIRIRVLRDGTERDRHMLRAAFRTIEARNRHLLLNGKPLNVRGLLNWGYQQSKTAPATDPRVMREELELARSYGFNLMKMCLWIPPGAYLDLADELGILVWMEYPAWHPQFAPQFLEELTREYTEFFAYDRNHPSVILRSLTCETGQSADLAVIRALYDLCHASVPNGLVEDDSSWIEWNRVHDFYDDHPYGNNHTWPATLRRLNNYISSRKPMPLLLGEAIAADTWYGPVLPNDAWQNPMSPPRFAVGNHDWLRRMQTLLGPESLRHLRDDSLHYSHLMRKYQIETFRREVPQGGYTVSVIRDFSLAGMGLIDYFDQPKWNSAAWSWHGDTMLLLRTTEDRRGFFSAEPVHGELLVSHFGPRPLEGARLNLRLQSSSGNVLEELDSVAPRIEPGQVIKLTKFSWRLPEETVPRQVRLVASLSLDEVDFRNDWPFWIVPRSPEQAPRLTRHESWDISAEDLGIASGVNLRSLADGDTSDQIVLTRRIDSLVLRHLERGGRCLLFPDDRPGSFPLRQHWFLRGGPVVDDRLSGPALPRQMLVELQHFDLAGPVVPDLHYLDDVQPLLTLWDNHDIMEVKTHGLVFEMPVGKGRLMVSALRHTGEENAAGRYILAQLLRKLEETPETPAARDSARINLECLRRELTRRELALDRESWKFMPDADHTGGDSGWQRRDFDDSDWPSIRIDRHWEAQGYQTLDGWAWYRLGVRIPADWPEGPCYLNFTGVDDYYRLYVNGAYVGSGGDIETKQTAFEERKSHNIAALVHPGQIAEIAVEVYDWYGAGGIFRPVTLSTTPLSSSPPILK